MTISIWLHCRNCFRKAVRKALIFQMIYGIINADNIFLRGIVGLPHFANLPASPQIHEGLLDLRYHALSFCGSGKIQPPRAVSALPARLRN